MLSLQSDVSVPDNPPYGHPLGIDVGLDKFLATSDNELIVGKEGFILAKLTTNIQVKFVQDQNLQVFRF